MSSYKLFAFKRQKFSFFCNFFQILFFCNGEITIYAMHKEKGIMMITMEEKRRLGPFEKRIHEIDLIRGFLIIIVVLDHVFWCLQHYGYLWYGENHWLYKAFGFYWYSTARNIIQPLALGAFCFVSGVSTAFSRNNWKRVSLMLIFWGIIAIGSNIIQLVLNANNITADIRVDFNIIGCLAFCSLIYCFLQKRSWKAILAAILIAFLFSSYLIPFLRINLYNTFGGTISRRPGASYEIPNFYMILFWEYPRQGDYVALFPFVMFFLAGALFSYFFYKERKQSLLSRRGEWERPICFIGRHTLIIYLAHFLVIRGIFILISLIAFKNTSVL